MSGRTELDKRIFASSEFASWDEKRVAAGDGSMRSRLTDRQVIDAFLASTSGAAFMKKPVPDSVKLKSEEFTIWQNEYTYTHYTEKRRGAALLPLFDKSALGEQFAIIQSYPFYKWRLSTKADIHAAALPLEKEIDAYKKSSFYKSGRGLRPVPLGPARGGDTPKPPPSGDPVPGGRRPSKDWPAGGGHAPTRDDRNQYEIADAFYQRWLKQRHDADDPRTDAQLKAAWLAQTKWNAPYEDKEFEQYWKKIAVNAQSGYSQRGVFPDNLSTKQQVYNVWLEREDERLDDKKWDAAKESAGAKWNSWTEIQRRKYYQTQLANDRSDWTKTEIDATIEKEWIETKLRANPDADVQALQKEWLDLSAGKGDSAFEKRWHEDYEIWENAILHNQDPVNVSSRTEAFHTYREDGLKKRYASTWDATVAEWNKQEPNRTFDTLPYRDQESFLQDYYAKTHRRKPDHTDPTKPAGGGDTPPHTDPAAKGPGGKKPAGGGGDTPPHTDPAAKGPGGKKPPVPPVPPHTDPAKKPAGGGGDTPPHTDPAKKPPVPPVPPPHTDPAKKPVDPAKKPPAPPAPGGDKPWHVPTTPGGHRLIGTRGTLSYQQKKDPTVYKYNFRIEKNGGMIVFTGADGYARSTYVYSKGTYTRLNPTTGSPDPRYTLTFGKNGGYHEAYQRGATDRPFTGRWTQVNDPVPSPPDTSNPVDPFASSKHQPWTLYNPARTQPPTRVTQNNNYPLYIAAFL